MDFTFLTRLIRTASRRCGLAPLTSLEAEFHGMVSGYPSYAVTTNAGYTVIHWAAFAPLVIR